MDRLRDAIDRRWLTNDGRYVVELEQRLCEVVGAEHCVVTCNGTVALEILLRAAETTGEVILPSLTFVASAHAVAWQRLSPVFADVDPVRLTLDPRSVESEVGPQTSAILAVHVWGRPCDVDGLSEVARERGLKLFLDAAQAVGSSYRGRPLGGLGDATVFSFHATKICNSFEGGAIATNDPELAARARLMRNFGFEGEDRVVALGTNGKMSEAAAAMGLTSLEDLDRFIDHNRDNYDRYRRELSGVPGVRLLEPDPLDDWNYHYVTVEVEESECGLTRDELQRVLKAENVLARRYFYPGCHRMEPYVSGGARTERRLPVTERVLDRVLSLPTGTAVAPEVVALICASIATAVAHAPAVRARLTDAVAAPA